MKFRGHETFYIRKGWLYKGISNVHEDGNVFMDKKVNPMDVFGIGSNMVKSLRYWLQAVGLTAENQKGKRYQTLTDLGELIFTYDKYFQEVGTLWLVHYKLATNEDLSTSWYVFFNYFDYIEFSKEDFFNRVTKYVRMKDSSELPANRAIEDDFNCLVNTYLPKVRLDSKRVDPENNIECPLAELGLVDIVNKDKKVYRKSRPTADSIPALVVLAVILENTKGALEVPISKLLNDPCNVGKVFNLDTITLLNVLYGLERSGYIKVIRTAGLDVVKVITKMDPLDCIREYYESLH